MRFGVHERGLPDTNPPTSRPLGNGLQAPVCEICRDRFAYRTGIPFEEQKLCALCARMVYVVDRVCEALKR